MATRSLNRITNVIQAVRSRTGSNSSTAPSTTAKQAVAPTPPLQVDTAATARLKRRISYPLLRDCSSPVSPVEPGADWGVRAPSRLDDAFGEEGGARAETPFQQLGGAYRWDVDVRQGSRTVWLDSFESLVHPEVGDEHRTPRKFAEEGEAARLFPASRFSVSMSTLDSLDPHALADSLGRHTDDTDVVASGSPLPDYPSPISPSPSYHRSPATSFPTTPSTAAGFSFARTPPLQSPIVDSFSLANSFLPSPPPTPKPYPNDPFALPPLRLGSSMYYAPPPSPAPSVHSSNSSSSGRKAKPKPSALSLFLNEILAEDQETAPSLPPLPFPQYHSRTTSSTSSKAEGFHYPATHAYTRPSTPLPFSSSASSFFASTTTSTAPTTSTPANARPPRPRPQTPLMIPFPSIADQLSSPSDEDPLTPKATRARTMAMEQDSSFEAEAMAYLAATSKGSSYFSAEGEDETASSYESAESGFWECRGSREEDETGETTAPMDEGVGGDRMKWESLQRVERQSWSV